MVMWSHLAQTAADKRMTFAAGRQKWCFNIRRLVPFTDRASVIFVLLIQCRFRLRCPVLLYLQHASPSRSNPDTNCVDLLLYLESSPSLCCLIKVPLQSRSTGCSEMKRHKSRGKLCSAYSVPFIGQSRHDLWPCVHTASLLVDGFLCCDHMWLQNERLKHLRSLCLFLTTVHYVYTAFFKRSGGQSQTSLCF